MPRTQRNEADLTEAIIQLIRDKKPRNVEQLAQLTADKTSVPKERIIEHIVQLQSQGKLTLKELPTKPPKKLRTYLQTEHAYWYWTTLALVMATTVIVLVIPENAYPLAYLRHLLGTIFVLWFPGYSFTKALFPNGIPTRKSANKSLDPIERIALSTGMSLALVPIVGLILNYTPWGIRLTPLLLSLLALTTIFATASILRNHAQSR